MNRTGFLSEPVIKNGRDRSPQRSGEWNENATRMKMLEKQIMDDGSHLILSDRPEDRSLPL